MALVTALPGQLGTVPELLPVREVLNTERALVTLRAVGAGLLRSLPPPLGLRPARSAVVEGGRSYQHETGPDPPGS